MTRWNIKKIVLYSTTGELREVDFLLNSVNIITGQSNTGKTSLISIVDYTMNGNCQIPSFVRDECSWVGVLWEKTPIKFLILRKIHHKNRNSSESYFLIGENIELPIDNLEFKGLSKTTIEHSVKVFEELIGIDDIDVSTYYITRPLEPITIRHVLPYLIIDKETLTNDHSVFRGGSPGDIEGKRQSIIDRLPYFLGVYDSETYLKEEKLRVLQKKLDRELRKEDRYQFIKNNELEKINSLLAEAIDYGLIERSKVPSTDNSDDLKNFKAVLHSLLNWSPDYRDIGEYDILEDLYLKQKKYTDQVSYYRSKIKSINNSIKNLSEFEVSVGSQFKRLKLVDSINIDSSRESCPICFQNINSKQVGLEKIQEVYSNLEHELTNITYEKPRINKYYSSVEKKLQESLDSLNNIRNQIRKIVKEKDEVSQNIVIDQKRFKLIGKISQYFEETYVDEVENDVALNKKEIEKITNQVINLQEEIDAESINEQLTQKRTLISSEASKILRKLPFHDKFRNYPVDFNPKDLSIGLITPKRRETMAELGSDENSLSLQISFHFAFQRFFNISDLPVPAVLIIDQISRPYFPQNDLEKEIASLEYKRLKKYFDFIFDEVRKDNDLQVIILEHAYFNDDPEFVFSTKERWIPGHDYLIPNDWLQKNGSI